MLKKKAISGAFELIGAMVIILFVVFWWSGTFAHLLGKGSSQIVSTIDSTEDSDGDGIPDFEDQCDCKAEEPGSSVKGCPLSTSEQDKKDSTCKKKK